MWTQEAYRPPCSRSLGEGGSYLGQGAGGTYLSQGGGTYLRWYAPILTWLGRVPTLVGGTYLGVPPLSWPGWGVPTLGYPPDLARDTYLGVPPSWPGLRGYLPWGTPPPPRQGWTDGHLSKQYLSIVLRARVVINIIGISLCILPICIQDLHKQECLEALCHTAPEFVLGVILVQ